MTTPDVVQTLFGLVQQLEVLGEPIYVTRTKGGYTLNTPLRFMVSDMLASLHNTSTKKSAIPQELRLYPVNHDTTVDINNAVRDVVNLCLFGIMALNPNFDYDEGIMRSLRMNTNDGIHIQHTSSSESRLAWTVRCSPDVKYWSKANRTHLLQFGKFLNDEGTCPVRVMIELSCIRMVAPHRPCLDFVATHIEVDDEDPPSAEKPEAPKKTPSAEPTSESSGTSSSLQSQTSE